MKLSNVNRSISPVEPATLDAVQFCTKFKCVQTFRTEHSRVKSDNDVQSCCEHCGVAV